MPGRISDRFSGRKFFQTQGITCTEAELNKTASVRRMPGRISGRFSGRKFFRTQGILRTEAELK